LGKKVGRAFDIPLFKNKSMWEEEEEEEEEEEKKKKEEEGFYTHVMKSFFLVLWWILVSEESFDALRAHERGRMMERETEEEIDGGR